MRDMGLKAIKDHDNANVLDNFELFKNVLIFSDVGPNDLYITGSKFKLPYRRLRYKIYPCSLPNPADCASFTDMAEFIFGDYGFFKGANYSKKADPLKAHPDSDNTIPLTVAETVVSTTYLKTNFIYDDDRDFMDERQTHSYVDADKIKFVTKSRLNPTIYCTAAQIEEGSCEPYMILIWRSSFDKTVIQRRYTTPFQAFSEIGEFCDLIVYGIMAIYFSYNTSCYVLFLRSQLVDGFLELDEMRRGEEKKRSTGEIQRLKSSLMEMKVKEVETSVDKKSLSEVLKTKVELKDLVQMNFKAKIMIHALIKNQSMFSFLANQRIFLEKIKKKKNSKILKGAQQGGLEFKEISKKQILRKRHNEEESSDKISLNSQKFNQNSNAKGQYPQEALIKIDLENHLEHGNSLNSKILEKKNSAKMKQTLGEQKKLKITFSKRKIGNVNNRNKLSEKQSGVSHPLSKFAKTLL